MPNTALPDSFIALSHRLADASGEVIRKYYRAEFHMETKEDQSPVTIADKETEQTIRDILAKERPQDAVHGEEFGAATKDSEYLWIIDPIDGTKSFATGRPLFATLIGLYRDGVPVLGVIDQPVLGDRWIGGPEHPTTLNGKPVRCRPCPGLKQAQIGTYDPFAMPPEGVEKFRRIAQDCAFTIYGGDAYTYGQLAAGFLDAVIDENMKLHDFAALTPIIEGAGGKITGWAGETLRRQSQSPVVAAGDARLHEELLRRLAA